MKRGFTLVEIMVVIVIIGMLAAVGVPKLLGMIEAAHVSNDMQALNAVHTAVDLASIDQTISDGYDETQKNEHYVVQTYRIRLVYSTDKKYASNTVQGAVLSAIKSDAGIAYINRVSTSTSAESQTQIFETPRIREYAQSLMVLVERQDDGSFRTCAIATSSNGASNPVVIYTYRGKPIAVGDIPGEKDVWAGKLKFKYQALEDL